VSGVIRPAGPLPARVYWVRRGLLAVAFLLVLTMMWWAAGRLFGGSDSAGAGTTSSSPPGPAGGGSGAGPGAADAEHNSQQVDSHKPRKHKQQKPTRQRPAAPSGDCAPTDVDMSVVVHDVAAGHTAPVDLRLTSVGVAACTLAVTPDTLALRITSGSDVVWTSDECPNSVLARELVVRAHQPTVYTFDWNGYRSTPSCSKPGPVAEPGGYWAEAALIGADVHRAYFDVK
jgi:hypothetical protein